MLKQSPRPTACSSIRRSYSRSTIPRLVVHLCGSWYDSEESSQLVRAPRLWTDEAGQMWAAIGDEAPELVVETEVSHMHQTISIRTAAGETFVCSLADCSALGM